MLGASEEDEGLFGAESADKWEGMWQEIKLSMLASVLTLGGVDSASELAALNASNTSSADLAHHYNTLDNSLMPSGGALFMPHILCGDIQIDQDLNVGVIEINPGGALLSGDAGMKQRTFTEVTQRTWRVALAKFGAPKVFSGDYLEGSR